MKGLNPKLIHSDRRDGKVLGEPVERYFGLNPFVPPMTGWDGHVEGF